MPRASETKLVCLVLLTLLALLLPAMPFRLKCFDIEAEYRLLLCTPKMQGQGAGDVFVSSLYGESRYSHSSSTRRYSSSHRRDRSSHRYSHYRPRSGPQLSSPSTYHPHLSALSIPTPESRDAGGWITKASTLGLEIPLIQRA